MIFYLFFFWIFFKVTKVPTKIYLGYYRTPKMLKNSIKRSFFAQRAKKVWAEGRSSSQELYLLVSNIIKYR